MQADGLILAGGRGTRMDGKYKGGLLYGEETFMDRLIREMKKEAGQIYVSYGACIHEVYENCKIVMDEYTDCGPIGGLHAGLKLCGQETVMVAACDMPFLGIELYRFLQEQLKPHCQGVVPVVEGRIHPLAAIYKKEIIPVVEEQIEAHDYRLTNTLDRLNICYVDLSDRPELCRMFQNINTVAEYVELTKRGRNKMSNLTIEQARALLFGQVGSIEDSGGTEEVALWDAVGRVLAQDIVAVHDQPPFPRSPLDGYAVRSADIKGASRENPATLKVIDEVTAGHVSDRCVTEKTAVRIMTGAPIPDGADCIVGQEDTDYGEDAVSVYEEIGAYMNYCYQGEDYKAGDRLLAKNTHLGAVEAGILASLGLTKVMVYRKIRAALITTGDEIILPGEPLTGGQIYDSNLYTLGTRMESWGMELLCKERAGDDAGLIADMIDHVVEDADMIVTTGGVSVGKKDIMHDVLKILGCERLFWRIAVKPGMPTLCGRYKGKLIICLSGNPFGATVNLELLVRPLLVKMSGRRDLELVRVQAVSDSAFPKKSGVTRYIRAYYREGRVRILGTSNSSGILSSMSGCNCLIEIPAGSGELHIGDKVWAVLI